MKLTEKVKFITSTLDGLYPNPDIPLDHENNFTFLVAVMLSAQSTDKKVNEITPTLFQKAKTPAEMNRLKTDEIQKMIRQIGLAPTKAKNIKKMYISLYLGQELSLVCTYIRTFTVNFSVFFFIYFHGT